MEKSRNASCLKSELIALVFSAACAAVFIFISCAAAVGADNPDGAAVTGATLALMLTAFSGGFSASKLYGKKGLVCGAAFGAAALATILIIGAIAQIEISIPFAAVSAPIFALVAILGGISGTGSIKSGKRKKPHRKKIR